jgi:hypothetical protein
MSILIKGMEMPTEFDPDVYIELACGTDGERYARLYNFHQGGITEWCEVIHVPPHGRLGDLDVLYEDCALDHGYEVMATTTRINEYMQLKIDSAPTIISAEEGET